MSESPYESLAAALAGYQLELPGAQVAQLEDYCRRLWDWNTKLNLTRHTDFDKFVSRDLVDSLQISLLLESAQSVLDVGTGGGVPGVVLAILRPDLKVSLCESVGKKARVVEEIVRALGLPLAVHHERAEKLVEGHRFERLRPLGPWGRCGRSASGFSRTGKPSAACWPSRVRAGSRNAARPAIADC